MSKVPFTCRMDDDLLLKLRATVDVLSWPNDETISSIVEAGVKLRLRKIHKENPQLKELIDSRMDEMKEQKLKTRKSKVK